MEGWEGGNGLVTSVTHAADLIATGVSVTCWTSPSSFQPAPGAGAGPAKAEWRWAERHRGASGHKGAARAPRRKRAQPSAPHPLIPALHRPHAPPHSRPLCPSPLACLGDIPAPLAGASGRSRWPRAARLSHHAPHRCRPQAGLQGCPAPT